MFNNEYINTVTKVLSTICKRQLDVYKLTKKNIKPFSTKYK